MDEEPYMLRMDFGLAFVADRACRSSIAKLLSELVIQSAGVRARCAADASSTRYRQFDPGGRGKSAEMQNNPMHCRIR